MKFWLLFWPREWIFFWLDIEVCAIGFSSRSPLMISSFHDPELFSPLSLPPPHCPSFPGWISCFLGVLFVVKIFLCSVFLEFSLGHGDGLPCTDSSHLAAPSALAVLFCHLCSFVLLRTCSALSFISFSTALPV